MAKKPAKMKPAAKRAAPARAAKPKSTRKIISTPNAAKPGVPLSQAVQIGNILFVSGTTPFDANNNIAKGDFAAQMHQVMGNIKAVLAAAGSSLEKVAKCNVILTRISDFWTMNGIYKTYFKEGNYPARTTLEAPLAHPDFLLEIECVAEA